MKNILSVIILTLLLFINHKSFSQDSTRQIVPAPTPEKPYTLAVGFQLTGIGLGFANPKGFTLKYYMSPNTAMEYVLTPGGQNIIGSSIVFQRHFPVQDKTNLYWYAGAGSNLDVYQYEPIVNSPDPFNPQAPVKARVTTTTTLLAALGAEYSFEKAPFVLAVDIKSGILGFSGFGPTNRYNIVYGLRPSLSFRYILNT